MIQIMRPFVVYIVMAFVAVLIVLIFVIGYVYKFAHNPITVQGKDGKQQILIRSGTTVTDTASLLKSHGLVPNALTVEMIMRIMGKPPQAGLYTFKQNQTVWQIITAMQRGDTSPFVLMIPEGMLTTDVIRRLQAHTYLTGDIHGNYAEGTLLPETYHIEYGTSRTDVLVRMQNHQQILVDTIWKNRNETIPLNSKQDLVILASIVEMETPLRREMPLVAGVYLNRLKKRMYLNADPTVAYGLTMGKNKLQRLLTRGDLRQPSPYNTYLIHGLPPTPISNPGRHALESVANPAKTDYLYFVANGTGGHTFAKTYAEHKKNVAKWYRVNK